MANKHVIRRSTLYVIRELQIKTTMRDRHQLISRVNVRNAASVTCRGARGAGACTPPVGVNDGAAALEGSLALSQTKRRTAMQSSNCAPWYLLK